MSTALGRFKIVDQNGLIAPGCCIVCGSISGEFLDFGFTLDYYGAIYFCFDTCFKEAANTFEYYSPSQHRAIRDEVEFLRRENNQQKDQIEEMTRVFGELTSNIAANISSRRTSGSNINLDKTTSSDNESSNETKSRSDEQIDESGPTDIQLDDGIEQFISDLDI